MFEQQAIFIWLFILTAGEIVRIIASLHGMRRKPSISDELYKGYVSKTECEKIRCAANKSNVDQHRSINERLENGNKLFRELERSMGRIEGKLEQLVKLERREA